MTSTDITSPAPKVPAVVAQLRSDLTAMQGQFQMALPAHIPVERFVRVIMTAVQREPKLLACDRQSFFVAALQAANDGLLPDGREGVLLPFSSDDDEKVRSGSKVTWIPMIYGLRKKVRNAGVLSDWNVQVVHQGDAFDYQLGDEPFIHHKPAPTGGRTRPVTFAYSIATFPDGTKSREVMNIDQIKDIQKLSRAKKGPWSNPTFFPEMCRKTVARLHSKQLPMSTDLDRVMHRDDALYDFEGAREAAAKLAAQRPSGVAAALDFFGGGSAEGSEDGGGGTRPDPRPGGTRKPDEDQGGGSPSPSQGDPSQQGGQRDLLDQGGAPAPAAASAAPKTPDEYRAMARAHIDAAKTRDEAQRLEPWFVSDQQRNLRIALNMTREHSDEVRGWITAKIASFTTTRK